MSAIYPSVETAHSGTKTDTAPASVAIIMRTRHRPLLLPRALSSVLSQKLEDWHLYLVNDGGDVSAVEELLEYYHPLFHGRLTVIHREKSEGMEAASNAALSLVQETFVAIHDDDDSWHPRFLEATVRFLSDPSHADYVGVTSGCVVLYERIVEGQVLQLDRQDWWEGRQTIPDFGTMLRQNLFPPICLLFRERALRRIGPFDPTLAVLGDWEFNLRLMREGDIGFVPDRLAFYHKRILGTNSAYSNTVIDDVESHVRQSILLRNRYLRESLATEPQLLGQTQSLAYLVHEEAEIQHRRMLAIEERLGRMEQHLERTSGCFDGLTHHMISLRQHLDTLDPLLKWTSQQVTQIEGRVGTLLEKLEVVDSLKDMEPRLGERLALLEQRLERVLESVSVFGALFRPLRRLLGRRKS